MPAFGIDFGTTNSAIALARPDGSGEVARFSFDGTRRDTFRSVLYFDGEKRGAPLGGPWAIERYLEGHEHGRLIQSIKSLVASRVFQHTQIAGRRYTVEDLVALLVRSLRTAVEREWGSLGTRLVVGRPVRFVNAEDAQDDALALKRLRAAFAAAGFSEITFEYEPVGAAYYYESRLDQDELILIADFGGGTSDFSLLHVGPGVRRRGRTPDDILGTAGAPVAGDAFDAAIVRHVVSPALGQGGLYRSLDKLLPVPDSLYRRLERWHHLSFLKSRETMATLRSLRVNAQEPEKIAGLIDLVENDLGFHLHRAVQQTKYALSDGAEAPFTFRDSGVEISAIVRRADFDDWIAPELSLIGGCVDRLLAGTRTEAAAIDRVFLTGGSSLVPAVRSIFAERFGEEKLRSGDEFTSVARGLAMAQTA